MIFFFKQKTAYEMRISDWSSDVCSSDLPKIEPQSIYILHACSNKPLKIKADVPDSGQRHSVGNAPEARASSPRLPVPSSRQQAAREAGFGFPRPASRNLQDRKSTRLNSSH